MNKIAISFNKILYLKKTVDHKIFVLFYIYFNESAVFLCVTVLSFLCSINNRCKKLSLTFSFLVLDNTFQYSSLSTNVIFSVIEKKTGNKKIILKKLKKTQEQRKGTCVRLLK